VKLERFVSHALFLCITAYTVKNVSVVSVGFQMVKICVFKQHKLNEFYDVEIQICRSKVLLLALAHSPPFLIQIKTEECHLLGCGIV
jgi:hypothetical protein